MKNKINNINLCNQTRNGQHMRDDVVLDKSLIGPVLKKILHIMKLFQFYRVSGFVWILRLLSLPPLCFPLWCEMNQACSVGTIFIYTLLSGAFLTRAVALTIETLVTSIRAFAVHKLFELFQLVQFVRLH